MARIPAGREVLQVTVDTEIATLLRVKAALRRVTVGDLVQEMAHSTYDRDQEMEQWVGSMGDEPPQPMPRMKALVREPGFFPARAPGGPKGRPKHPGATESARAEAWTRLEAFLIGAGLPDHTISDHLKIAPANVVQWRKAGMVPGTRVAAVLEFLTGQEQA